MRPAVALLMLLGLGVPSVTAQSLVDGRYMADTISHNDHFFHPFGRHEPAENCTFLHLQHAPGTDWGRWMLHAMAFEEGTDILAGSPRAGVYVVRSDTVRFDGFVDRKFSVRVDTLEFVGESGGNPMYARWIRIGDPVASDFEAALTRALILRFGCER